MPAFLVHGVPDTHRQWNGVRAHLTRTDVIAPDLPGFGGAAVPPGFDRTKEAYAAWLVSELEDVGEPVDLVGHDWGSILACRVATTRPDLVRTLAVGGGPVDETYVWHDMAQLWQTPAVGEQVMEAMVPDVLADALAGIGLTPEQAATTARHVDEEMRTSILALYRSAVTVGAEWAPDLTGFDRPALVLWGEDDPYAPPTFAHRMGERLSAEVVVFEGCHHWWPLARAAEVAVHLEALWDG